MWTVFKVFIEFFTILFLFWPWFLPMRHVGSWLPTRDQTHIPHTGRWSLTHWTHGEVPRETQNSKWCKVSKTCHNAFTGEMKGVRTNSQITLSGIIYTSLQIIIKENWKGDNTMIKGIKRGMSKMFLSVLSHSAVAWAWGWCPHSAVAWAWGWCPLYFLLLYLCKTEECLVSDFPSNSDVLLDCEPSKEKTQCFPPWF